MPTKAPAKLPAKTPAPTGKAAAVPLGKIVNPFAVPTKFPSPGKVVTPLAGKVSACTAMHELWENRSDEHHSAKKAERHTVFPSYPSVLMSGHFTSI